MNAAAIVDKLLEADPDDMSPETLRDYLTTPYTPRYARSTVNLGDSNLWSNESALKKAFTWLTRIGATPNWGSVNIHYYQQEQCKAIDAIHAACTDKGIKPGWTRLRRGVIQVFSEGKWVPVARVGMGAIVPL